MLSIRPPKALLVLHTHSTEANGLAEKNED